jgi:hypothetical protein
VVGVRELGEVLSLSAGAVFRRVDLHVHTPASADMPDEWKSASPDDVVRHALAAGMDVIAVTDHNTAEWCDRVREAAAGTALHVLPGVEVSTAEGHLLAIFDAAKPGSEIREFLIRIGFRERELGCLDVISKRTITEVAAEVESEGGVAIAAHVDREAGFWQAVGRGVRRQQIHDCREIRAFEIVDPDRRAEIADGSTEGYPRKVPCVQGSDCYPPGSRCHQLDAIGHRFCHLKMDVVSIAALKQALVDPDARICFRDSLPEGPRAVIEGMWVSGGFLEGQQYRFSDNISCLIGGTGAGKSLTLELIRFGLDQQVDEQVLTAIAHDVKRLLGFALGELQTVYLLIRKGGDRYVIQRTWASKGPLPPSVWRVQGTSVEQLEESIHVPTFFSVKAFSQSEIIEYARQPLARLSLIDDLIDLSQEDRDVAATKAELRQNAGNLLEVQRRIAAARATLQELPGITEDIANLSAFFDNPRVKVQEAWDEERSLMARAGEGAEDVLTTVRDGFPRSSAVLIDDDADIDELPNAELLREVREIDKSIQSVLQDTRERIVRDVEALIGRLAAVRAQWSERFEEAQREYRQLLAELDATGRGLGPLHQRLLKLRERERTLQATKQQLEAELVPRQQQIFDLRERLLDRLQRARKSKTKKRQAKASELTQRLGRVVSIEIKGQDNDHRFQEQLRMISTGARIPSSDIPVLAGKVHPVRFVKSLLDRDFAKLADLTGLGANLFERLLATIEERGKLGELYELQAVDLDDLVKIRFAIGADGYRDLESLAHGQKCTVVLMIALAEGESPLLVDQPEDALHAPWIEDYIVRSLRSHRGRRQCLFATRSANVLVSADAEQIIAMQSDAQRGRIQQAGGIDSFSTRDLVLYHVEGGKEAFARRQKVYGLG